MVAEVRIVVMRFSPGLTTSIRIETRVGGSELEMDSGEGLDCPRHEDLRLLRFMTSAISSQTDPPYCNIVHCDTA